MEAGTIIFAVFQIIICLACTGAGIYFCIDADRQERKRIAVITALGVLFSGFILKLLIFLLTIICMAVVTVAGIALALVGGLLMIALPFVGLPLFIWKKLLK